MEDVGVDSLLAELNYQIVLSELIYFFLELPLRRRMEEALEHHFKDYVVAQNTE